MKAVLLLHGFKGSKDDFGVLESKLESMYDTIKFASFPGHEEEGHIRDFDVSKTFDVLLSLFDDLKKNHNEVDIIGFSMGGALTTYLQSVREVNKIVLLAPANKYNNKLICAIKIFWLNFKKIFKKNRQKKVKRPKNSVDKITIKELQTAIKTFRKVIAKCNNELKEITVPTLIIWGKSDPVVPKRSAKNNYELCTNTNKDLQIYKNVGHIVLHSKKSEIIIDEIVKYLK